MVRERGLALAGQLELHRVADLVRERAHVVHLIREVQHDVRQRVLGDGGAERAAALARARLGVDAVVAVEAVRDGTDARREVVERVGDERRGIVVGDGARRAERRVLVGQRELVQAEQLRLVPEPAVREVVMALDRGEQDVDRLARQLVVEVARLARVLVAAHAVEHEPVGDERVVDVREHRRLGLERREQRLVGREARLAHRPAHAREHLVDRAILAVERHAQRRGDLIEERVPRARRRRDRARRASPPRARCACAARSGGRSRGSGGCARGAHRRARARRARRRLRSTRARRSAARSGARRAPSRRPR